MPRFSVVIPTYNRANETLIAIESVLNQTIQDFEVIVVDDASTDDTADQISLRTNDRVKLVRLKKNGHMCVARNAGVREAKGDWIYFLDSDDEMPSHALERLSLAIDSAPASCLGIYYKDQKDDGSTGPSGELPDREEWNYSRYMQMLEEKHDGSNSGKILIRRSVMDDIQFPEDQPYTSTLDMIFWLDCIKRTNFFVINEALYTYHLHDQGSHAQMTKPVLSPQMATVRAEHITKLFDRHGDAMSSIYPSGYIAFLQNLSVMQSVGHRRAAAVRSALRLLRYRPLRPKSYALLVAVLIGHRAIRALQGLR